MCKTQVNPTECSLWEDAPSVISMVSTTFEATAFVFCNYDTNNRGRKAQVWHKLPRTEHNSKRKTLSCVGGNPPHSWQPLNPSSRWVRILSDRKFVHRKILTTGLKYNSRWPHEKKPERELKDFCSTEGCIFDVAARWLWKPLQWDLLRKEMVRLHGSGSESTRLLTSWQTLDHYCRHSRLFTYVRLLTRAAVETADHTFPGNNLDTLLVILTYTKSTKRKYRLFKCILNHFTWKLMSWILISDSTEMYLVQ